MLILINGMMKRNKNYLPANILCRLGQTTYLARLFCKSSTALYLRIAQTLDCQMQVVSLVPPTPKANFKLSSKLLRLFTSHSPKHKCIQTLIKLSTISTTQLGQVCFTTMENLSTLIWPTQWNNISNKQVGQMSRYHRFWHYQNQSVLICFLLSRES